MMKEKRVKEREISEAVPRWREKCKRTKKSKHFFFKKKMTPEAQPKRDAQN